MLSIRSTHWARVALHIALFAALLFPFAPALAKGPPDKVVITGPGLKAPVEIEDREVLETFSFFQFENSERPIEPPEHPGYGYVVTRFVAESQGEYTAWDRLIYLPNPGGSGGVVFYEGLLGEGMSSEFDGGWYLASAAGDAAMREILTREGVLSDDTGREQVMGVTGGIGLIIGLWLVGRLMGASDRRGPEEHNE
jgi:hypothetical protein